ncbi:hypothetical protein GEV33_005476 [Tenebrio molitor]|uniref:Uncharacterized protein n=1 Tax=Tenebrio molitor TaxID=7067 RepID=A0A8J6LCM1_TENMO|nr:hypothetical protein GEV33_005476 [Tenebrio molitor]
MVYANPTYTLHSTITFQSIIVTATITHIVHYLICPCDATICLALACPEKSGVARPPPPPSYPVKVERKRAYLCGAMRFPGGGVIIYADGPPGLELGTLCLCWCAQILPCRTSDAPGPRDGEAPERDRARTVSPTPPALSSSTARFKNPAGGDGFYNIFQERGIVVGWLAPPAQRLPFRPRKTAAPICSPGAGVNEVPRKREAPGASSGDYIRRPRLRGPDLNKNAAVMSGRRRIVQTSQPKRARVGVEAPGGGGVDRLAARGPPSPAPQVSRPEGPGRSHSRARRRLRLPGPNWFFVDDIEFAVTMVLHTPGPAPRPPATQMTPDKDSIPERRFAAHEMRLSRIGKRAKFRRGAPQI